MRPITVEEFVRCLDRATASQRVFLATGVGSHQSLVARYFSWDYPDRMLLTSCGHGTMGSGLPLLMGAALERPNYLPILVTGDGSFAMEMPGLITVADFDLPLKIFVLDNAAFGIVQQYETLQGIPNVATVRPHVDFRQWAESCGVRRVDFADGWQRQVARMITLDGPWFMQIPVADIGVWPILEAGHEAGEMSHET